MTWRVNNFYIKGRGREDYLETTRRGLVAWLLGWAYRSVLQLCGFGENDFSSVSSFSSLKWAVMRTENDNLCKVLSKALINVNMLV